jgi:AcrR family transcriptional regulator
MTPKVTRQHKQEVRTKILDAAEKLISKEGYHNTSMDEIVEESGLSKGAIYGYFRSKDELFLALQDRQLETSLKEIRSTFAPEDSAKTKLEKATDMVFSSLVGLSKQACRMNLEFAVAARAIKSLQRMRDRQFKTERDFVAGIINEGIKTGEFRRDIDPDSLASMLIAMVDGLALNWASTSFEFDWEVLKDHAKKLVLEGLQVGKPRTRSE